MQCPRCPASIETGVMCTACADAEAGRAVRRMGHTMLRAQREYRGEPEPPCVHFIGFGDGDRYYRAVAIFGLPDFYHRIFDVRAKQEIIEGDIAIFADGDETMPLYCRKDTGELVSWDASQQDIIARGIKGKDW